MSVAETGARAVLGIVRELAPRIREAAPLTEQARELPRPLFEALADAGLFHLMIPRQLGGAELDLPTYLAVIEEVGRADGSTAWCLNQGAIFATHACCTPPALAREIWFDVPRSVVANTPAPTATARPVPGGFRVTGRQPYSTGSLHASWIAARGKVVEDGAVRLLPDGAEDIRFFMIPVGEVTLLDTWHTSGLRGTGTHDFEVTDHFVPEHRTFSPTSPPRPEYGPVYAINRNTLFAIGDAGIALGVARAGVEAFIELAHTKVPGYMTAHLDTVPMVHYELGQAEALLRAARALLYGTVREVWEPLAATGALTMDQRVALRTATTFALRETARVVDTVYNLAGATAVPTGHPLQRQFQDIHVITQHVQSRLAHYELIGRRLLDQPTDMRYL